MFKVFKEELKQRFEAVFQNQRALFVADVSGEALWDAYLASFSDEVERQAHTCTACRQFIKNWGNVVVIVGGEVASLWDFEPSVDLYKGAASSLNTLVSAAPIRDVFLAERAKIGVDSNVQSTESGVIVWNHFFLHLPTIFVSRTPDFLASKLAEYRDHKEVFQRALEDFSQDIIETVLELIAQNSIYRGQQFEAILIDFLRYKKEYDKAKNKNNFCWIVAVVAPHSILRIRNESIGTLLKDLAAGRDLDSAVRAFESIMAPQNYKRPNPVVTKKMVEQAEKRVEELGLGDSLLRRVATKDDIPIGSLLFVNRDARKATGVFEQLKEEVQVNPRTLSKVEEVTWEVFVSSILPTANSVQVLLENIHLNNFVTLVTEGQPGSPGLFMWDNPFSWSYTNAVTDSIKERVKDAGGRVEGELRVSLSWRNFDDLDLHVIEPDRNRIYFGNKTYPGRGTLDVDKNAGFEETRTPVENIIFANKSRMLEGLYNVEVNNFTLREYIDVGFEVEIESRGELFTAEFSASPRHKETIQIAELTYSHKDGITVNGKAKSTVLSKEKWGISTNRFHKVGMIMKSPNYWAGNRHGLGNEHLFFLLEGARSDERVRPFFNEFLKQELVSQDRRVFEVLGSQLVVERTEPELAGLGFSTTQRNSVIVQVEGNFKRLLKIKF